MPIFAKYGALDTPFAEAGDVAFLRVNNRLRPDQLKPGELAESINGRMDLNGAWQPRKGVQAWGGVLTANTRAIALTDPPTWELYSATPVSISSAERVTTTVTIVTTGSHGFTDGTLVYIGGLTGTVDPNGNRLITVTNATTFTFTISGATGNETYAGTGTAEGPELSASQVSGVYGSCTFSNPSATNKYYIIRATNLSAVATCLISGNETIIEYPAGVSITSEVSLLQAFDKVYIFRDGATALEWDGVLTGSPAFTEVADGVYTQPVYMDSSNNTVIADGVATVTQVGAHGLAVGDFVYVVDNGSTSLTEGERYTVAGITSSTIFTVRAQVPDASANTVVWSKKISVGKGFIHMPSPPWATSHQGRLWMPYMYEPTVSGPLARDRTDEIIASDVLDGDTYDALQHQFRITAGISDHVEGLHPFAEDNLLVFNRNSIHLVSGVSGELQDTVVRLVTDEIGCVARQTIIQVGNEVLFLSDNGLYAAQFGDLYNLRGAGVPLSESVKATLDRINRRYAYKALAAYYNNRYYLAFPLDDSTVNNAILIYNFLNKGWESLDTNQSGWDIQNLLVASSEVGGSGLGRIYAISSNGSIHILDEREDANDYISTAAGVAAATYPIESSVTTRQYTYGMISRKTFSDYELQIESSDSESTNGDIGVIVENYDHEETLTTVRDLLGGSNLAVSEDASLRGRIGNKRGYGIQVVFTPTNGRPILRTTSVTAGITNASISQAT
jgi:hypothetical protein